ncbi:efflux RND transporter periplasmic adaptor subunit [Teredinibacter sp. KSP-S5-2]|uniref:efflux RND transporter periplasmic adaptor subunit n=1 Tax=Teredinibacter sp. KSP-S5-2 TaxID=3034506 RepID=UPI0029345AE8|nr:efflux RND transporter periplasmic adaptor subunit [Teredinibacter sp. KSP-S5-2]WNO09783.1 efflux RND transporter periplasmic adaptor subunit [Teredinibacter sp. KSP-S5-2]
MKKVILSLLGIICVILFIGTIVFLYNKSQEPPVIYQTASPFETDIIKKTIATGSITPRKEVEIKSQVSGIVEKIYVEAGNPIGNGEVIAKIRIIPDIERLNNAESLLETARINFEDSQREKKRQEQLFGEKIISEVEYNKYLLDYKLKQEALTSAESNLAIVREGASKKSGKTSNLVSATLDGLILDIPVKEGTFITETNNFNAGTTIAFIANMQDMIFEGRVDESEVGKLHEGMQLLLNIGAIESEPFTAELEYISPKGYDDQGTIKFQIRASVNLQEGTFIRAGFSANADIVLDKRENVLALNEGLLQFDNGQPYVEVQVGEQKFERRDIKLGISDGINIEVLDGITLQDKIKKPM